MADKIDELVGLTDEELSKRVGLAEQLKEAKAGLAKMAALTGDARKEANERVEKMFAPNVYPSEFKWIAESAERHAKNKGSEGEARCCDPCSVLDD